MEIIVNDKVIKIKEAVNFKDKLIGFMFKKNFDYGIRFKNVKSIHTFFMKENIDIIQTDRNDNVIDIFPDVKKNKIIIGKSKVYYTYELPRGYLNIDNNEIIIKNSTN